MKKIILFLAGILLTGAITAQNDTAVVMGKPEKYFANFYPPDDWNNIEADPDYFGTIYYMSVSFLAPETILAYDWYRWYALNSGMPTAPTYMLQQFHTDHPIKIIGAALWTRKETKGEYLDSVLLYDADSNGNLTYLWGRTCDPWDPDSLKWLYDTIGPWDDVDDYNYDPCQYHTPRLSRLCIHEYYMGDTASIIVEDTFYLGFTYWNTDNSAPWGEVWHKGSWVMNINQLEASRCADVEFPFTPQMYSMDGHTWIRSRPVPDWPYRNIHMIWPIIDVEYGQDTIDSVSVGRVEPVEEIKVSPNPARERVSVEASRVIDHLWVKNTQGVEIYNNTHCTNRVELNVNWWPKGVYVLYMQLNGDPVLHARKLVVE